MSESPADKPSAAKRRKIIVPALLGILVSGYLIATTFHVAALQQVHLSGRLALGLLLAAGVVVLRDFGFLYKIRLSTDNTISWKAALVVILLWEFGSAVTPGAVGGIALALFILAHEGFSYGKSTAIILLNTFLDNFAFVVVFALLYFFLGQRMFDVSANCPDLEGHPLLLAVRQVGSKIWIGYFFYVGAMLFIGAALFLVPRSTKRFFHFLADRRWLKFASRWLRQYGTDMETASQEFKHKSFRFWGLMLLATFLNWMARFALPNALFLGFSSSALPILDIYARQYVTWIFLVLPTTPGASGVAEVSFMAMNCDFMPQGLSAAITTIWRLYSYYLYLVLGMLLLPRWLKHIQERTEQG